jgi:hypothetical protein
MNHGRWTFRMTNGVEATWLGADLVSGFMSQIRDAPDNVQQYNKCKLCVLNEVRLRE